MKEERLTRQVVLRLTASDMRGLEARSFDETVDSGKPVSVSDLVRRGISLVLTQPGPERPKGARPCVLVPTVADGTTCLRCSNSALKGDRVYCADLMQEVDR